MGLDSPTTLIIIGIIVLLLFGGKKIPELMKGLGSGVREFKNAQSGEGNTSADIKPTDQPKG